MKGFTLQPLVVEIAAGVFKVKGFFFCTLNLLDNYPYCYNIPRLQSV